MSITRKRVLLLLFIAQISVLTAQTSQSERLQALVTQTTLDEPTLKPWHMVLDVTLYDIEGKNPRTASVEVWQSGTSLRIDESLGDKSQTTLRKDGKLYRSLEPVDFPSGLDLIVGQILQPAPERVEYASAKLIARVKDVGTTKLDCIDLDFPSENSSTISLDNKPSYCFYADGGGLAISYGIGSIAVVRSKTGLFQGIAVPLQLLILRGKEKMSEAHITSLKSVESDDERFALTDGLQPVTQPYKVSQIGMAQISIHHVPPTYPMEAKRRHVSGSVVFDAVIGQDGHVESLQPTGSPDSSLLKAARDVVSQWTYKPYKINGVIIRVITTITVNFNLA